nr:unnamed protein product [Callosobruchus analis]
MYEGIFSVYQAEINIRGTGRAPGTTDSYHAHRDHQLNSNPKRRQRYHFGGGEKKSIAMNGYGYSVVISVMLFSHLLFAHPTLKKNEEEDDDINPYLNKLVKNRTKEEMENETRVDYWNWNALQAVQDRLFRKLNENTAKNVIFFLGDGMSIPTIAATRVYLGVYAHTASRNWESDTNVLNAELDPKQCRDIAYQLIFGETGKNLQVILGGGRKKFLPKEVTDEEGNTGSRSDDLNLIQEWKKQKKEMGAKYEYVWNRKQLLSIKNDTEYLLGLFEPGHMKYNLERSKETEPSLEEMTEVAIRVLQRASANSSTSSDTGFFLFVEGGRIDTAHHSTFAHKALDETAEFAKAVQRAVQMTNEEDTLIVVTADHAHTMSFSGYAGRGSEIFGYAGQASDSNLYTILNYANGPGYRPLMATGERYVPSEEEMNEVGFKWPSTSPLNSETHGADDVAVFAKGPWAHLFTGTMEENVIPHLIAAAACVSPQIPCANFKKQP